jgi:hypothetical protein
MTVRSAERYRVPGWIGAAVRLLALAAVWLLLLQACAHPPPPGYADDYDTVEEPGEIVGGR